LHRRRTITKGKFLLCEELKCHGYIQSTMHSDPIQSNLYCKNTADRTQQNNSRIFSCGACYRCISTDILPATRRCAGPGCLSACTTDCRSASTWPSRPAVGRLRLTTAFVIFLNRPITYSLLQMTKDTSPKDLTPKNTQNVQIMRIAKLHIL